MKTDVTPIRPCGIYIQSADFGHQRMRLHLVYIDTLRALSLAYKIPSTPQQGAFLFRRSCFHAN
jgi:hypothetical protein